MRLIAWLLTIAFGLAGIAFRVQGGIPNPVTVGTGLLVLAALACPLLWSKDGGLLRFFGVRGKDRFLLSLSLLLAVPLLLPWPFWL